RHEAAAGHADAGAAAGAAALRCAEDVGCLDEVVGRNISASRCALRGERLTGTTQTFDTVDVLTEKGLVDEAVGQQDVEDARDERGVLARARLEVHVRQPGRLAATRIDHHELHPAVDGATQLLRRVLTEVLLRDDRVGADEEPRVGLLEAVAPTEPAAVHRSGYDQSGLVDRRRREEHARPDRLQQRGRHAAHGRVGDVRRADVQRDRPGTVTVDDVGQTLRALRDQLVARDHLVRSVGPPLQAVEESVGTRVHLRERTPLRARVATDQRRAAVTVHLHRAAVFHRHEDRAQRGAETAEARFGHAHRYPPMSVTTARPRYCACSSSSKTAGSSESDAVRDTWLRTFPTSARCTSSRMSSTVPTAEYMMVAPLATTRRRFSSMLPSLAAGTPTQTIRPRGPRTSKPSRKP